jgi:heme iron utilization protein
MNTQLTIRGHIEDALRTNNHAVLATEGNGQPHACFIAITPIDNFAHLIFATYRDTRKYKNLVINGKVAILFENRSTKGHNQPNITVLTAFGHADEVDMALSDTYLQAHLSNHPQLESFLLSRNCALFKVKVNAYQVVLGIDDVNWWNIED